MAPNEKKFNSNYLPNGDVRFSYAERILQSRGASRIDYKHLKYQHVKNLATGKTDNDSDRS